MYTQQVIHILKPFKKVCDFLKNVENLPIWTKFFISFQGYEDGFGKMSTLIGSSLTSIEETLTEKVSTLTICSRFGNKIEKAMMIVTEDAPYSHLSFTLNFPPMMNEENKSKMIENLKHELMSLKQYLESLNV